MEELTTPPSFLSMAPDTSPTERTGPRASTSNSASIVFVAVVLLVMAVVVPVAWLFGRSANTSNAYRGPYDPVVAGEELPDGYRQVLPRDAIRPVYDPVFVQPGSAGWDDSIEVIGVFFGDEAKAYPVSFMTRREIVVDELDGIPILVSW